MRDADRSPWPSAPGRDQGVQGRRLRRPGPGLRQRQRQLRGERSSRASRNADNCPVPRLRRRRHDAILHDDAAASLTGIDSTVHATDRTVARRARPGSSGPRSKTTPCSRRGRAGGFPRTAPTRSAWPPAATRSGADCPPAARGGCPSPELARHVEREGEIAVDVLAEELAVEPDLGVVHHPAERQVLDLARPGP